MRFEAASQQRIQRQSRHHIAHLQVIHPDDIAGSADLGVAANMQALWAVYEPQMNELTIPFLGPERTGWQYPFGDLARSGARLAAGSDWPVSSPDPLAAVQVAVNRRTGDGEYEAFLPEQALDLATALAAYTSGSAWVNHADETGRIAVGACSRTWPCSTATRSRDRWTRSSRPACVATYVEGELVFGA